MLKALQISSLIELKSSNIIRKTTKNVRNAFPSVLPAKKKKEKNNFILHFDSNTIQ